MVIADALTALSSVFTWAIGLVTANPVIFACFCVPLAGAGFSLVKKLKRV